jgi:ABC-type phosphate/phosphonate transport system substrate-binding protein
LAVCVTIIRFGVKELDDDNLAAGAKPLRDGIAASLGVDDADPRVLWQYAQVIEGGRSGVAVKIDEL